MKFQYWLKGAKDFKVISNQKALSDIYFLTWSREFADFLKELRNLSEATMKYNFWVVYVPGKTNLIAG